MTTSTEPPAETRALRHDGWTPERRRTFLEALAEGHTVEAACAHVGMSRVTAYALRRRDRGFALAWSAAVLRARDAVADTLTSRALDGQVETLTRADGSTVTRHRYDIRLGLALLARLDRLAAQPVTSDIGQPHEAAVRGAAYAFDALLALVEEGEADADTVAAFIEPHIRKLCKLRDPAEEEEGEDALQPESGQAHDDAQRGPIDEADGDDVAVRKHPDLGQFCKLREGALSRDPANEARLAADPATPSIWFAAGYGEYHTCLPPPEGFARYQHGRFGEPSYWRVLTPGEIERQKQRERAEESA